MLNELTFRTRTVLNTLVLVLALARARHLYRRLWARVLTVVALPVLTILWALEQTVTMALNVIVLLAWLVILRNQ